ncbi:SspB family protein [Ancylobacter dichloromethanicus]
MSVDLIRYDLLVQDALRGVVGRVLTDVARDGLPGEHHLYLAFDTCAPGVRISPRLKERYPEEMTIVLQHQFWDLIVTEQFFEVGLSFNGIPERLHVPFEALKGFFDPSVKFGLQFEPLDEAEDGDEAADSITDPDIAPPTPFGEGRPTSVPSTRGPSRLAEVTPRGAPEKARHVADRRGQQAGGGAAHRPRRRAGRQSVAEAGGRQASGWQASGWRRLCGGPDRATPNLQTPNRRKQSRRGRRPGRRR